MATVALGKIGPAATAAIPDIVNFLSDPDRREDAARAILKIDPTNNRAKAALKEVNKSSPGTNKTEE